MRNKNTRRAVCKLYIDGEDISGGGFIIGANSFVDIERPVNVDRKFKFVSLESEDAYDHGKNGANHDKKKGTIVAEFALQKELKVPTYIQIHSAPLVVTYPPYPYNFLGVSYTDLNVNSDYHKTYCQNPNLLSTKGISQATYDSNHMIKTGASINNFSANAMVNFCGMGGKALAPDLQDGATVEGLANCYKKSIKIYKNLV